MVNKNHIHVKLQNAHTAETGAAGTWAAIGYIAPGAKQNKSSEEYSTTVFDYTNKTFSGANNNTTMVGNINTATEGRRATDCTFLTPNFANIAHE